MLDMAKREKVVQTYGRHRNRVITTNDLWSSGEERGKTLFSSSEDSSLSITDRSRNVSSRSFNSFSKTRSIDKHSANKENRSRKPRRAKVKAVDRLFALTDSANSSQNTSNVGCRKALRDRNGIFDIKSDEKVSKKPQTDKRKRPRRAKRTENKKTKNVKGSSREPAASNLKSDTSDLKIEASHFNFSQFDNYSLVLSDSPLKEGEKISGRDSLLKELSGITVQQTPDIVTRGKPALRSVTSVETSTPNIYHKAKRTDAAGKIKPEEISLIEHFDSNPNTPYQESKEQEYAEISAGVEKLSLGDSSKNSKDVRSGNTYQVTDRQELTYALRKCQVVLDRCKNLTQNDESEDANCESTKACDTDGIGLKSCEIMVQKITDSFVTRRRRPACKSSNGKHASLDSIVELSFDASADLFDTDTPSEHSDAELADLPSPKRCYMLRGQGPVTRNRNVSGDSEISAISEIEEEEEVETDEDEELVSENDDQEQASDVEQGETEEEEEDSSSEEEDEDECKAEESEGDEEEEEEEESKAESNLENPNNTTLYMLNDSQYKTPSDSGLLEAGMASMSYHTAEGMAEMSVDSNKTDAPLLSLSGHINSLCRSFKEVLTPSKSKNIPQLTPEEKVLLQCEQDNVISFSKCIPSSMMNKCTKIGEGVYGEVFRTVVNKKSVALKIIPIEGDFPVNDEPQKTYEEILPEIMISRELSAMKDSQKSCTENYVEVRRVSLVKGQYPAALLKQWDIYDKAKRSENDRPDIFGNNQLFIVFEFADGGCALEGFKFESILEAKSVLHQVVCALAVAEAELEFEHRDLHWGNVLVKRTNQETLQYKLNGELCEIKVHGVTVSIIDFTLSRLRKDGCTIFTDLSVDKTLFEGEGDYQFEVYRLMKQENQDNWEQHHPFTNVLWINYLTDKLIHETRYPGNDAQHRALLRDMKAFYKDILTYRSAVHMLTDCQYLKC